MSATYTAEEGAGKAKGESGECVSHRSDRWGKEVMLDGSISPLNAYQSHFVVLSHYESDVWVIRVWVWKGKDGIGKKGVREGGCACVCL